MALKFVWHIYECEKCKKRVPHTGTIEEATTKHSRECPMSGEFCQHCGRPTERDVQTGGCGKGMRTVFECDEHGGCLPLINRRQLKRTELPEDVVACIDCDDFVLPPEDECDAT